MQSLALSKTTDISMAEETIKSNSLFVMLKEKGKWRLYWNYLITLAGGNSSLTSFHQQIKMGIFFEACQADYT